MADTAYAMRRHESLMEEALRIAKTDTNEEHLQEMRAVVAASFNEAQSAWDAYREHLIQHGFNLC